MPLILASASKTRADLLSAAGIDAIVAPVGIDEVAIRDSLLSEAAKPHEIADALAEFKARRAADRQPTHLILGCDQVLDVDGTILSKPTDLDAARGQLRRLQGRTHRLISAAVLYEEAKPVWRATGQARMTMHALEDPEIDAYLEKAWPDVAESVGAYHAEGFGARLFSRIDGDWFSVLGLPLLQLLSHLRLRGALS